MTYTTIELILYLLLIDISAAIALTALYALTDEIALSIIYGKNKAVFDKDYYIERLLSIFVIGLVPVVGFIIMMWWLWTFANRVEAFVFSIMSMATNKCGIVVKKENKVEVYNDWIFV